jgi:hypothetical protein
MAVPLSPWLAFGRIQGLASLCLLFVLWVSALAFEVLAPESNRLPHP